MSNQHFIELTTADGRKLRAIQCAAGQEIGYGRPMIAKQLSIAFVEDGSDVASVVLKCATVACVTGDCEFRPHPDTSFRIPAPEARRLARWAAGMLTPKA